MVDDFPATVEFFRYLMHLQGGAPADDEVVNQRGYARLWNCSTPNFVELEIIDREKAPELLGGPRLFDERTLVYSAYDVDGVYESLLQAGAESVAEPFGDADTQGRYAQVRAPDGSLIELHRFPPIPHFGGLFVAAEEG